MTKQTQTEIELKLSLVEFMDGVTFFATPALLELNAPAPIIEHMEARYYDTDDLALQKAGVAFRTRLEGNHWVATVKTGGSSLGGLHQRQEWNIDIMDATPDISVFENTDAAPILTAIIGSAPLIELFQTSFDRYKTEVTSADGSQIELAVDLGSILAGDQQSPIAEIELELLEGSPTAILSLGAYLAQSISLVPETRSKFARGLQLIDLAKSIVFEKTALPSRTPIDTTTMATHHLVVQIHHVFLTIQKLDPNQPDSLHQLRIQIRRLRSLLSFVKPLLELEGYTKWQNELRLWSHSMNELREIDVLYETWQAATSDSLFALTPPPWLKAMLQTERTKLINDLFTPLYPRTYTPLLLGLWAWLSDASWSPTAKQLPFSRFTKTRLTEWLTTLRDHGKDLTQIEVSELHQLRISGKKLRYVLEDLVPLDRKTKLLLACLKVLNERLGHIHDATTIVDALTRWMSNHASRALHRDAGILLGWVAQSYREEQKAKGKSWRQLRRAARRWIDN